jgi:hypothetical protein
MRSYRLFLVTVAAVTPAEEVPDPCELSQKARPETRRGRRWSKDNRS